MPKNKQKPVFLQNFDVFIAKKHPKTFICFCLHPLRISRAYCFHHANGGENIMACANKNQSILCDVTSCQHHAENGMCRLDSIKVAPRTDCHSGKCDESECASYHARG